MILNPFDAVADSESAREPDPIPFGTRIPVGRIETALGSSLTFECELSTDGKIFLHIFAWDGDGRTKGVLLSLAGSEVPKVKTLLTEVDKVIGSLKGRRNR
jgi:hypothetical protein